MNACVAILLWPKQSSGSRGVVERSTTKGFVSIREIICRFAFPCRSGQPSRESHTGSPASEMQTKPECAGSGHCSDERELPSKQRSALGHAPHSPALVKGHIRELPDTVHPHDSGPRGTLQRHVYSHHRIRRALRIASASPVACVPATSTQVFASRI